MTDSTNKHNDTKLLLVIGGAVLAAAVGWIVLAGLSAQEEVVASAARPAEAQLTRGRLQAEPALLSDSVRSAQREPVPASVGKLPGSTVDTDLESRARSFIIGPEENLVAGGLQAYGSREYAKAVAYFEKEIAARSSNAWTQYMLGLSRWKAGDLTEAASALERSIELDPQAIKSRINLSRVENERGNFEAALAAAVQALEIDPEDATARFLEGRSLYNLSRTAEALASLEKSVASEPDNGHVHNLIGLIYIERQEFARAAQSLELAAEREPEIAYIQNNLGMALERSGERSAALAAYRRAVELDRSHTRAAANLARLEPLVPAQPAAAVAQTTEAEADVTAVASPAETVVRNSFGETDG